MTVPIGAGGSGFSTDGVDGVVGNTSPGATGISGMADLTQANVQASKYSAIQGNPVLGGILGQVFDGLSAGISLPLAIIEALVSALFDLIPGFSSVGDALGSIISIGATVAGDIASVIGELATAITGVVGAGIDDIASFINAIVGDAASIATTIATTITDGVTSVITIIENVINWIAGLFGLGNLFNTGGGGGADGVDGPPELTPAQSLQQLLGLLDTSTPVPADLYTALAPGASANVLSDPGFDTGDSLQGQGLWCWDSWVGTGDFAGPMGSIRTIRPGLITIYNIVGTSQGQFLFGGEPIGVGGSGIILEYLRDPDFSFLVSWALTGTDQSRFEWINVPYPAAQYPMGPSVSTGATWLINQIKQTPGPFILIGDSQGCQVAAAVYDELRFGTLKSRRQDLLAALAYGNLRREKGHTFPGYPDPAPGTSGMCDVSLMTKAPYKNSANFDNPAGGNLIDTEDLWWDFCVAGDYYACTPIDGVTVVPPDDAVGGNVGCIEGIPGRQLREFYTFINQAYNGNNNIITDVINWGFAYGLGGLIDILLEFLGTVMQQINNLGSIASPHNSYFTAKPFAAKGDERTFIQIGLDYIATFADNITPPVNGVRHQFLGQRFAVKEFQVVTAGAQVMWTNVVCVGPAIMVAVNAYDADQNLIATITATQCVISDPEPNSSWAWVPLQADFVMPAGTKKACIVLDVEPEAMTTGIVWFDDCIFEPSTLFDAAWLDVTNIPQLDGAKVAGPQGQADILTAWQNTVDGLASANNATQLTGVQLADLLQSQGMLALTSSTSYELGVLNHQILSNVSTQPVYNGLQPTGEVTFPLTNFTAGGTLPSTSVASGTTIAGFINCALAVKKGFIEFMAKGAGGSGVYVNVYEVDKTTGNMTALYASSDISGEIPNGSWGWVGITIAPADQIAVTQAELVCLEIVAQSSTISVAAEQIAIPNNSGTVPQNLGATRTTLGTISPTSVSSASLTYSGTVPFICFGISDVPPNYQPPNQTNYAGAGVHTYEIPDWLMSGNLLDLVSVGGGGCGGAYTDDVGQGGIGGSWTAETLTYGTGISTGVTELNAIVGLGGPASSAGGGVGGDTIIGHGLQTIAFDAVGAGGTKTSGSSLTFKHTATAGAYVVLAVTAVATGGSFNKPTYAGVPFKTLGASFVAGASSIAEVIFFGIGGVPGGLQDVVISLQTGGTYEYVTANTFSYTGVSGVGALEATSWAADTGLLSQDATCGAGQVIVQAFATGNDQSTLSALTGGTQRYSGHAAGNFAALVVSEANTNTTFTAHCSGAPQWVGAAAVLNPGLDTVITTAAGGTNGGTSSNPHTDNPNTTSKGLSSGNETFAGRTYYGGPNTTTTHLPGNAPGGGSAGGDASFPPQHGADGAVWITARQS